MLGQANAHSSLIQKKKKKKYQLFQKINHLKSDIEFFISILKAYFISKIIIMVK